jgi:hypothetical protein
MAIGLHTFDRTVSRSNPSAMFGIKQIPLLFRMATTTEASVGLPTWSITTQLPLRRKSETIAAPGQCTCAHELTSDGTVYNEEAFRYLLQVERKRYEASAQPFALVLIDTYRRLGHSDRMETTVAANIFSTLVRTLRETDLIGWYRNGRVIGVVLTHLGDAPLHETTRQMSARVKAALSADLSPEAMASLKVRLYRPRARMTA